MLGGVRMVGLVLGASGATGGSTGVSEMSWLPAGLALSCFSGEMPVDGSGSRSDDVSTGLCDGDECCCGGEDACFMGEKDGRCAESGGWNEVFGLEKLGAAMEWPFAW